MAPNADQDDKKLLDEFKELLRDVATDTSRDAVVPALKTLHDSWSTEFSSKGDAFEIGELGKKGFRKTRALCIRATTQLVSYQSGNGNEDRGRILLINPSWHSGMITL